MARLLIALAVVAAAALATEVPFKDCKSKAVVKSLEATDCEIFDHEVKGEVKKVCRFKSGTRPTIKITFTNTEEGLDALETSVRAKFGKSTLPYAMTDFETCKHGGLACPLKKDTDYTYSQDFTIDPSYPKGELFQVNWAIGKGDEKAICVVFLAKIE